MSKSKFIHTLTEQQKAVALSFAKNVAIILQIALFTYDVIKKLQRKFQMIDRKSGRVDQNESFLY